MNNTNRFHAKTARNRGNFHELHGDECYSFVNNLILEGLFC